LGGRKGRSFFILPAVNQPGFDRNTVLQQISTKTSKRKKKYSTKLVTVNYKKHLAEKNIFMYNILL